MHAIAPFIHELSTEVHAYLEKQNNGKFATPFAWFKAIALLISFFALYFVIIFGDLSHALVIILVVAWGLVALLIVFNVGHDAVHGSFSRHPVVNKILGYSFNLVGASAYSWKLKHNDAHHRHTNIEGKDHDTEMDPLLRVSPHERYRWYFRWQHIYWPLAYATLSILIIFVVDFLIFVQERRHNKPLYQPAGEWIILIFTKLFYITYILVIPVYIAGFSLQEVLTAFMLFQGINGLIIGLVFQPSHYFKESIFYDSEEGAQQWHVHQLMSTTDISPENKFLTNILGGLNNNVPHHLYPAICHVHYNNLSGIVKKTAQRYNVPYYRKTYRQALIDHVKLLKYLSRPTRQKCID